MFPDLSPRPPGLKEEDMGKPQVGISSMWYEGNPCNMHLLSLAEHVKAGVVSACALTLWGRPTLGPVMRGAHIQGMEQGSA